MSWGNQNAAPAAQSAFAVCEAPECKAQALIVLQLGEVQANSCCNHAKEAIDAGVGSPVGLVEGAPFDDATRDLLLAAWDTAKATLERAKNAEMDIRKIVFGYCFPNPTVGTQRVPLANGFNLKAVHKETTKIVASIDAIDKAEEEAGKIGNEGTFLFERIVVWKPDFSLSEFKKLDPTLPVHAQVKKLIEGLIETKPGAPTLEIEAPKAK